MSFRQTIAVAGMAVAVLGGWYHYQRVHLPAFATIQAEVLFEKCVRECREAQLAICKDLQIPESQCPIQCEQCRRYLEGRT